MAEKERKEAPPVRRTTVLPKPPILLSGRGSWIPPKPKPTQMPLDYPPYYPKDLKLQTTVIVGEALKKFPLQTQTLELCKYVVSELTPHFCAAVQRRTLRADKALSSMSDYLHFLLCTNCDDSSSHTESEKRFCLEQDMKKSDEWVKLAQGLIEVAEAPESDDRRGTDSDAPTVASRKGFRAKVRQMKQFWGRHWQWIITTLLTALALYFT